MAAATAAVVIAVAAATMAVVATMAVAAATMEGAATGTAVAAIGEAAATGEVAIRTTTTGLGHITTEMARNIPIHRRRASPYSLDVIARPTAIMQAFNT